MSGLTQEKLKLIEISEVKQKMPVQFMAVTGILRQRLLGEGLTAAEVEIALAAYIGGFASGAAWVASGLTGTHYEAVAHECAKQILEARRGF